MKNYLKILTIGLLAFGMNSCNEDDMLDLSPINNISVDDAYSTPSLIES